MLKTDLSVPEPKHWTDETPNLYNLVLTVSDEHGVVEGTGCRVGFRVLELKTAPCGKRYYTVNGKRIVLNGVNRHEMWLGGGAWVSPENHRLELAQMKALNINALRTSHYNCDPTLYDYCDEYGVYVFAEANLEPALLDRQKANVIPNRNHPSVIIWSICNEAGSGSPYRNMHRWVTGYEDETRIIFYKAEYAGNTVSNLDYPSPAAIRNYCEGSDPRPLILSEYAYAEVQGRGGLSDSYVFVHDMARDYLNFLGMFTWCWKDQSFYAYGRDIGVEDRLKQAGMTRFLGYQGMWGRKLYGAQNGHFALGAFACTGTVTGNNEYKPEAVDLKAAYSRIRVENVDLLQGKLKITNRYSFLDLSDFTMEWRLTDGENVFASGAETVDLPAGCTFQGRRVDYAATEVEIPAISGAIQKHQPIPGTELFLNVAFVRKDVPNWAAYSVNPMTGTVDGDMPYAAVVRIDPMEVSAHQLAVNACSAPEITEQGTVTVQVDGDALTIGAAGGTWHMEGGVLTGCEMDGAQLLKTPLLPELYAAVNEQLGPNAGWPQGGGFPIRVWHILHRCGPGELRAHRRRGASGDPGNSWGQCDADGAARR